MDFRISADDRVGGQPNRADKPQPRAVKGARVEPTLGHSVNFVVEEERRSRGNGGGQPPGKPPKSSKPPRRGKAQPAKTKKRRSGGFLMGLLWWGFVACLWGGLAVIGVVVYFGAQLPAANTWAIPERPPNIRILVARRISQPNKHLCRSATSLTRNYPLKGIFRIIYALTTRNVAKLLNSDPLQQFPIYNTIPEVRAPLGRKY